LIYGKKPETQDMYMLVGWRQWADAGSVSSGLPDYLIQWLHAERIGAIRPDGFYIFQFPGTHEPCAPGGSGLKKAILSRWKLPTTIFTTMATNSAAGDLSGGRAPSRY